MKCCFVCTRICAHTSTYTHTHKQYIDWGKVTGLGIDRGLLMSGRQYVTFTLSCKQASIPLLAYGPPKRLTTHTDLINLQWGKLFVIIWYILFVFYCCKAGLSMWSSVKQLVIYTFMQMDDGWMDACIHSVSVGELPVDIQYLMYLLLSTCHSLFTHRSVFQSSLLVRLPVLMSDRLNLLRDNLRPSRTYWSDIHRHAYKLCISITHVLIKLH